MRVGGVRRWWAGSVVAVLIVLLGSGGAQAADPATVSGTLGGAGLPKPESGVALVTATRLPDFSIVAATRIARNGHYALKLPKGDYELTSTLVRPGAALLQTSVPMRLRAGQRRRQSLSLRRKKKTTKKRARARGSGVNKYGYHYTGTAFAVDDFHGATGEWAVLNKGLPDILATDLANVSMSCTMRQVEWKRRKDLLDELALQQGPEFDPRYRLNTHKMIDPELFVRGDIAVSGPRSNPTIVITARIEDARTGTVRGTTTLQTTADHFFADVETLSGQIAQVLCRPPDATNVPVTPPPASSPAAPKPAASTTPTSYNVDVNVVSATSADSEPNASGTVRAMLATPLKLPGLWDGTGQATFSDVTVTSTLPGCSFDSFTSINQNAWTVRIESDPPGTGTINVLAWLPGVGLQATRTCLGVRDPNAQSVLSLNGSVPYNNFHLPIAGGTQQISSSDPFTTHTGTVTITPQY